MRKTNTAVALLLGLSLSTFVGACSDNQDNRSREALQQEALQKELDLALQPDTTAQPELADVAVTPPPAAASEPEAPAPKPAPQRAEPVRRSPPPPTPRRTAPAPEPEPNPAPAPVRPQRVTHTAPAGTMFAVRIDQEISTKSYQPGQTFTATLTEPLVASDGSTVIPAGATVRGRVTQAEESGRAGEKATLGITFTSSSYGGNSYPIEGAALNAPVKLVTRDSNLEKAGKIGGGAAIGAILGQIIGKNTKSTVAGAAIGAAAGTAVAIGSADVDAVIPAGSRVNVRLGAPVSVTE
ncbi:MAG TPA: hypothetical protein VFI96_06305 [Longimicrobiaceae bacterium]|nr:hypothetical protein [Longimicrobiaceae bacterium]